MSFVLPPDLHERVRLQLQSGEFASEAEVLREAIDNLEYRQQRLRELREMVAEADEDIANGRVGPFDREVTIAAVDERLAEHGITD